jgi:hypothetical protein
VGGKVALEDVMLLLVYMTKNHKEIIEDTKNGNKLYIIISDAVHKRNIDEVLEDINMDDPEQTKSESGASPPTKGSKCCVLM